MNNNSLGYNVITDDVTYRNYMALARAICGVRNHDGIYKQVRLSSIKSIYGLNEKDADEWEDKKKEKEKESKESDKYEYSKLKEEKKYKFINIRAKDIVTGEVKVFANTDELSAHFEVSSGFLSHYIRNAYLYKKRYTFEADINPLFKKAYREPRKVKVTNVYSKEVTIYDSASIASEKTNTKKSTVYVKLSDSSLTITGLRFEYLTEE